MSIMKHKKLIITLFALVAILSACKKEKEPVTPSPKYPVEIQFTDYDLGNAQWTNLDYPNNGNLIIINSKDELENYITCSDGSYQEIDFSEYILLVVSGSSATNVTDITKKIQQFSVNKYKLEVELSFDNFYAYEKWTFAIKTNKLSSECTFDLNLTCNKGEIFYIVGYQGGCALSIADGTGESLGYILISEDLKDTLEAYCMPKGIYNYPEELFKVHTAIVNKSFPEQYRYSFKIKIKYFAPEEYYTEELGWLMWACHLQHHIPSIEYCKTVRIIINSASKTE